MKKSRYTNEYAATPSQVEFETFYNDHYRAVARYVARRLPTDSFDAVVAATFVVAWRKFAAVPIPSLAWLYRIASFEVARERELLGRQPQTAELHDLDSIDTAPFEDVLDVSKAFSELSESDAELLRLVYWENLSRNEIADVMGLSVNAVNVRYHRALERVSGAVSRLAHIAQAEQPSNRNPKEKP
jgi:RNA polymerase sigma-70 factor (ECF subfamily)